MNFKINSNIFQTFPGFIDGIVVVRNIDNSGTNSEITDLLRQIEKQTQELPGVGSVNDYPKIAAWREAHKKFGSSPKKYAPSIQALFRRVYKGGQLPNINKLVDLYNYLSLKYVIPAGGEDLDACNDDIELTFADGSEEFVELGSTDNNSPEEGEVVYKDSKGVICRRFNWREADRTKLTDQTKNAVIVFEALPPSSREELEKALNEMKELVLKYCGGEAEISILTQENPIAEIL
ncbi:B3/4 domain-containing protein [Patescibacteria group bacterium]